MGILKEVPHLSEKNNGNDIEPYFDELDVETTTNEEIDSSGGEEDVSVNEELSIDNDTFPITSVAHATTTTIHYLEDPESEELLLSLLEPVSNTQSVNLTPGHAQPRSERRKLQHLEVINDKTGLGKKRARRQNNSRYLYQLSDPLDAESEPVINPSVGSKFKVLFEDDNAFKVWDNFNTIPEESQWKFLCELEKGNKKSKHKNVKVDKDEGDKVMRYNKLTLKTRIALERTSFPVGLLRYLEEEISDFFWTKSNSEYLSNPLPGFERLLTHGIATYHRLESYSIDDDKSENRCVRIEIPGKTYHPPAVSLSDYVTELHVKKW